MRDLHYHTSHCLDVRPNGSVFCRRDEGEMIKVPGSEYLPAEVLTDGVLAKVIGGLEIPRIELVRTAFREVRAWREKYGDRPGA